MEQPARFCEYCGKPLNAKARFCGQCGKPVDLGGGEPAGPPAQATPPLPPAPAPVQRTQPPPQVAPAPRPAQPPPAPPRPAQPPVQRQVPPPPPPSQPLPAPPPPNQRAATAEVVCGVIPGAFQKKGVLGFSQQSFTLVLTNYRVIFAMQTRQMMEEQVRQSRADAKQAGKSFFGQWGAQLSASTKYYEQKAPGAILAEQPGNFFILHNQLRQVKFHPMHGGEDSQTEYRMEFDAVTGKVSVMFSMIDEKKAQQALKQVLGDKVHWSHVFFGLG